MDEPFVYTQGLQGLPADRAGCLGGGTPPHLRIADANLSIEASSAAQAQAGNSATEHAFGSI